MMSTVMGFVSVSISVARTFQYFSHLAEDSIQFVLLVACGFGSFIRVIMA
jgi:hypothetical protein